MNFAEHVKVREEEFGTVIFDTLREKVFVTNETGKEILNLLLKGNSVEEIMGILGDIYQAEASQVRSDIKDFFVLLKENNLINS